MGAVDSGARLRKSHLWRFRDERRSDIGKPSAQGLASCNVRCPQESVSLAPGKKIESSWPKPSMLEAHAFSQELVLAAPATAAQGTLHSSRPGPKPESRRRARACVSLSPLLFSVNRVGRRSRRKLQAGQGGGILQDRPKRACTCIGLRNCVIAWSASR